MDQEPLNSGLVKAFPILAAPELRLLSARSAENCIELINYIKSLSEVLTNAPKAQPLFRKFCESLCALSLSLSVVRYLSS